MYFFEKHNASWQNNAWVALRYLKKVPVQLTRSNPATLQRLVIESLAKFDTGCLVFEEGNAVDTEFGEQVMPSHQTRRNKLCHVVCYTIPSCNMLYRVM